MTRSFHDDCGTNTSSAFVERVVDVATTCSAGENNELVVVMRELAEYDENKAVWH